MKAKQQTNHIVVIVMTVLIVCTLALFICGIVTGNPFILVIASLMAVVVAIWYLVDSVFCPY